RGSQGADPARRPIAPSPSSIAALSHVREVGKFKGAQPDRSVVPDLLGHRQPLPGGGIDGAIGLNVELVLEHPHELARMLACMPRGALKELVAADVAIVDL